MADIPKIVHNRLKVAATANHPDAGVLTAFSERSLSGAERELVLQHLSRCGECREIVFLAMPASEPVEVPVAQPHSTWLTWPTLRWGFAAAGIALIASLGIVQYQHHSRESVAAVKAPIAAVSEAKNEAPPASAASATPTESAQGKQYDKLERSASPSVAHSSAKKTRGTADAERVIPAVSEPAMNYAAHSNVTAGAAGGTLAHGPKMGTQANAANQWQQSNALQAQGTGQVAAQYAAPSPAVNLSASGRSEPLPVQAQAQPPAATADTPTVQSQSLSEQVPTGGSAEAKVDRAKPLETVIVSSPRRFGGTPPSAASQRGSSAQWTISSSGGLQRSLDRGTTWQDVHVNDSSASAAGGPSLALAQEQQNVKKEKAALTPALKPALKDDKQAPLPVVFRAVAANGSDVWAGGANGLLYHSTDAGGNWTRVVPAASGATLTGDIVTVDFADAQHGHISTSTSEIWTTTDDGQTWQKQ